MALKSAHRQLIFPFLFVAVTTGCAEHFFVPASAANIVPGTARTTVSNVTMDVKLNSWTGDPSGLKDLLTPVKVEIVNQGDRPLSIRYSDFMISNPVGVQSAALPPFKVHAYTTESAPAPIIPAFTYNRFFVYPCYGLYGPAIAVWPDDWGWDSAWYGGYYDTGRRACPPPI